MTNLLRYSEVVKLETFDERLDYLKLWDKPHISPRHLSQSFYKHKKWLKTRADMIKRDLTYDLALWGVDIYGPIYVHHINPLTEEDIENWSDNCFDPDNLICTSLNTHNAIHYEQETIKYVERKPGDNLLW